MKTRRILCALLVLVLAATPCVIRADRGGEDDDGGDGHSRGSRESGRKEKGDSDLEDVMEQMNGAFRKLRRQVADKAQNSTSLALIANLVRLTQRAAQLSPRMIARAPEKDRPGLVASYREQMKELIATFNDLQAALRAGQNSKAAEIVEDLRDLEKAGHHKFRTEESRH